MQDDKARCILNLLYDDAMVSQDGLASKLKDLGFNASRQNIAKYLEKLETGRNIVYSIIENPNIHQFRTFFLEIKTNPEEPEIVSRLNDISRVRAIDGIIGQNSLMVKVSARNDQQFAEILEKIDEIITGTRFQHYKIINVLKTFKDGGKILSGENVLDLDRGDTPPILDVIDEFILDAMDTMPERFSYGWLSTKSTDRGQELSYPQVHKRVTTMMESGIIDTFTIKIAPALILATDYSVKFYLQILPKQLSAYNDLAAADLAMKDEIVELYRTGEEYGILAVVRTGSIAEYRQFLESLYRTGKLQDTVSTLVIDEKMPSTYRPYKVFTPRTMVPIL
ncbi:MAG TPA: Lrp/AsnC family transcriptional regulator [Candidatus Lokiarchaeia archaeon]|nr:Lrp/AsnC family transcriptional regulator [Candidatus Lokiarchaeia archaeon]